MLRPCFPGPRSRAGAAGTLVYPARMEAPNAKLALSPVTRRKLTETVAAQLLQAIRELPPGTRVPSERELTRELGVGRSTVREALNGIAMLGIVEIRHGQGVFVTEAPPATASRRRSRRRSSAASRTSSSRRG